MSSKQIHIPETMLRRIYIFIFMLSGFSGLIYESIWTHYLKLFLGHAAYAQILVLMIFMGGMAIGSGFVGHRSARIKNLLLGYAAVEGLVGLFAIFFQALFTAATTWAYTSVIPALPSPAAITIFKWTLATLLILPQSILLGTTFPLMSGGILRRFSGAPGEPIAFLYFANSLGAAFGVLASGFVLIEWVGLPGTILFAGIINLLLTLIVWLLCRDDVASAPVADAARLKAEPLIPAAFYGFLLAAGLTGAASFMYEIGWIRMLCMVLGSSTHAFELMLSAFILGLALGGYWIKKRLDHFKRPVLAFGIIQIAMGVLALGTVPLYNQTFDLMAFMMNALSRTDAGYVLYNLFSHSLAILVMLPATVCAGMTLPLMTAFLINRGHGERAIGDIYSANTVGSILGVIIGSQWLMPSFGLKSLLMVGCGLDCALGLGLLWYAGPQITRRAWGVLAIIVTSLFISVGLFSHFDPMRMAAGVYRYGVAGLQGGQMLYQRDGKTATIHVFQDADDVIGIMTNGKPDAGISPKTVTTDEITMTLLGALPLSLNPQAETAAAIGLGSGMTTHTLLMSPNLKKVDTIEIEEAIIEGAHFFGEAVEKAFNDPRSRIYVEDAKTFFTGQKAVYDVIVSEPSNPWVSGVSGLFSDEFYHLINRHLSDNGLFVQWFHLYETDIDLVASVIKALSQNFGDYDIYITASYDMMIIATRQDKLPLPSAAVFDFPELKTALSLVGVKNIQDLRQRWIGSKQVLDPLMNSYRVAPNSDYFPVLDLKAVRARYLQRSANDLEAPALFPLPILDVLDGRPIRRDTTALTLSTATRMSANTHQAMQIRNLAAGKADGAELSPELENTVRNLLTAPCGNLPAYSEEAWLRDLHSLAGVTLPYLNSDELGAIWQKVSAVADTTHLSTTAKNWLQLYRAVSVRDWLSVRALGTALLPAGELLPNREHHYLLAALFVANIALKEDEASLPLWMRYPNRDNPPIELRLLFEYQRNRLNQKR